MSVKEAWKYLTEFSMKKVNGVVMLCIDSIEKYDEACDVIEHALKLDKENA